MFNPIIKSQSKTNTKLLVAFTTLMLCFVLSGCSQKVDKKPITITTNARYLIDTKADGIFTGTLDSDGKPEGNGRFECPNSKKGKWVYDGQFTKGEMTGKGKLVYIDDERILEGEFKNGLLNGSGTETKNKLVWKGTFVDGNITHGEYKKENGYTVSGPFKNGLPHRRCDVLDSTGKVVYSGFFEKGFPSDLTNYPPDYVVDSNTLSRMTPEEINNKYRGSVIKFTSYVASKGRFSDTKGTYINMRAKVNGDNLCHVIAAIPDYASWRKIKTVFISSKDPVIVGKCMGVYSEGSDYRMDLIDCIYLHDM